MSPFKHLPFLPFLLGRLLLSLLISSCSGIRNSPFSKRDILGAQRVLTLNFTKDEIARSWKWPINFSSEPLLIMNGRSG